MKVTLKRLGIILLCMTLVCGEGAMTVYASEVQEDQWTESEIEETQEESTSEGEENVDNQEEETDSEVESAPDDDLNEEENNNVESDNDELEEAETSEEGQNDLDEDELIEKEIIEEEIIGAYSTDWTKWDQAGSSYALMRSSGCKMVATAKMLKESGWGNNLLNPDTFYEWCRSNGYCGADGISMLGGAAKNYIAQQGGTGKGQSSSYLTYNKTTVMNLLRQDNTYVILYGLTDDGKNPHYKYLSKADSIAQGKPIALDGSSKIDVTAKHSATGVYAQSYMAYTISTPNNVSKAQINFVTPTNGSVVKGTIECKIKKNDNETDYNKYSIKFYLDNEEKAFYVVTDTTGYYFTQGINTTWFADGEHTLKVVYTNSSGSTATDTIKVIFRNKEDAQISFLSPTNGAVVKGTIECKIKKNDNETDYNKYSIKFYLDNEEKAFYVVTDTTGYYFTQGINTTWLSDGEHTLMVKYTNPSGSVATDSIRIVVENNTPEFLYVIRNGKATITGYNGTPSGELNIPSVLDGYIVSQIDDYAFSDCSGFTGNLTIPNTVTTIGEDAFSGCSGFTGSLTIPDSVTKIGSAAFYGCSGFTGNLTLPNSVTTIDAWAFKDCSGFTGNLTIPNSVTTIDALAFKNCSGFTGNLTIPNSVTKIGEAAFSGCSGFTGNLTIPNTVTIIEEGAFSGCSGFNGTLTISNSVTAIGYGAFSGCSGFTGNLTIPNSVTIIGDHAFYGCSGLTGRLTIPNSVTSIGDCAFFFCRGLTGNITIPSSVTTIGDDAFSFCSGFTGVLTIPSSVVAIGHIIINGTRITSVVNNSAVEMELPLGNWYNANTKERIKSIKNGRAVKGYENEPVEEIYSITYELFGGTNNETNPVLYKKTTATILLKSPTKTGYTFGGWYTNSNFKTKITQITKGSVGDKILYAKWTPNKYTISFNKNGGSGSVKTMSCVYDRTYSLRPNKFKRKGYSFEGWGTSKTSGVIYTNAQQISNLLARNKGKVTLYAQWKLIPYTYTYNLNAGEDPSAVLSVSASNTYYVTQKVNFAKPTRAGYTFKGWYTNAKCTKKLSYIKKGSTGNKTLYAKWQANKYFVSFNANGGSGYMRPISGTYAYGKTLPISTFTKDGYTFIGWSTSPYGEVVYADTDSLATLSKSSKAKKVTLYAIWE